MPLRGAARRAGGSRLQRTRAASARRNAALAPHRHPNVPSAGERGREEVSISCSFWEVWARAFARLWGRQASTETLGPHDWKENLAASSLVCSAGKYYPSQRYSRTNFDPCISHAPRKNTPKTKKPATHPPKIVFFPPAQRAVSLGYKFQLFQKKNFIKPGQETPLVLHTLSELRRPGRVVGNPWSAATKRRSHPWQPRSWRRHGAREAPAPRDHGQCQPLSRQVRWKEWETASWKPLTKIFALMCRTYSPWPYSEQWQYLHSCLKIPRRFLPFVW